MYYNIKSHRWKTKNPRRRSCFDSTVSSGDTLLTAFPADFYNNGNIFILNLTKALSIFSGRDTIYPWGVPSSLLLWADSSDPSLFRIIPRNRSRTAFPGRWLLTLPRYSSSGRQSLCQWQDLFLSPHKRFLCSRNNYFLKSHPESLFSGLYPKPLLPKLLYDSFPAKFCGHTASHSHLSLCGASINW